MKNFWLNKFRTGKRVRYKGADKTLEGNVGYVVLVCNDWVDVQFEFPGVSPPLTTRIQIVSVEKDNLEII